MRFTLGIALSPLDQLTELARTAEECGFASIALPDSLFYSEHVSASYPYTPDGSRFWNADTPWPDPMVAAAAMGAVTSRIRFYTQVLKLDPRNPLLLARQIGSVAVMTGNRFGLGVGLGWSPEESHWCGTGFRDRGARADEAIDIIRRVLAGGMVSFHGKHFSFEKLQMSPAPTAPVPFYIGGHTEPALKRAARIGDGWSSAMMRFDDLRETITHLTELRAAHGRSETPFEIQAVCIDRPGLDGFRQQAEIGVTDAIVVPWRRFDASLQEKRDALHRFADKFITPLSGTP
ncbi:TIGR03619 family F420-dependent LLM class oxidoreductase [Actinoplanes derwentensis]|uniref:Probable F420-dependent oxidoreductase, Rv2161c family n=1 Tax=Actinoplanes derwentensis TaxID=113562 RepID=A0A1H2AZJ7_9ACTN|nr:TIGR03619 family F420-dependent LLM class oxidoreductase [Actinoplanes derwentensis]GID87207.1 LLM class F420-dependent oxidoreductase [Actinoplanes derwentensis]SDT51480.1 probable F420-dependent oxidoreductase, Rv2161c family [Actinoplanes derwentensis]